MSILTKNTILEEMKNGNITIEPFLEDQVGPGSVDLHLGRALRVFKKRDKPFVVEEGSDIESMTETVEVEPGNCFILKPGQTVLGITEEKISLASNIAGWIEGRSRFARMGLAIHITAGFIQPGTANQQVLEIMNLSPTPLTLYPGTRICQVIFERCEGEARYKGKYRSQNRP